MFWKNNQKKIQKHFEKNLIFWKKTEYFGKITTLYYFEKTPYFEKKLHSLKK